MTQANSKTRTISGIQASGDQTLGNYIGAILHWVNLQETTDALYFIADLHAYTVQREPGEVLANTKEALRDMVASGLDPEKCILFVQSHVHQNSELAWLMQCVASFGELSRMVQFKEKSDSNDFVSAGLFTYPALMAADILLYDIDIVPVGEDQRQHVEFTRDIATRFNSRFGNTLVIPEHRIPEQGAKVMDLQNPTKKMSKSSESNAGVIYLNDDISSIEKKIKRSVTDNDGEVRYDPENKPGVSNLLTLLSIATGTPVNDLEGKYEQYGPLKSDTAEALISIIEPIQTAKAKLSDDDIADIMKIGATKASEIAENTMDRVRKAIDN